MARTIPITLRGGLAPDSRPSLDDIGGDYDGPGGYRWREVAAAVYSRLQRSVQDSIEQDRKSFPKTHRSRLQRAVPTVFRLARELSTFYVHPTLRTFPGLAPGAADQMARIYRGAQVDRRMRTAQEHTSTLMQSTVWVWPTAQGVRLLVPPCHWQEVEMADALSDDVRDVSVWWLRVPLSTDSGTGARTWAVMEFTAETAVWAEHPTKRGEGVWLPNGQNPIGTIPVAMTRAIDPAPGEFWSPMAEDILNASRAVDAGYTDQGNIARLQGYSQPVVKGLNSEQARQVNVGPEEIIGIPTEDGDFKFETPSPALSQIREMDAEYLRAVLGANGQNVDKMLKATGVTGLARQMGMVDRRTERQRHQGEFRAAERRIYSLIRKWLAYANDGFDRFAGSDVTVEYREPEPTFTTDPLHEEQARRMRFEVGLTTPAAELAREEPITLAEAEEKVAANLEANRAAGIVGAESAALAPATDNNAPPVQLRAVE